MHLSIPACCGWWSGCNPRNDLNCARCSVKNPCISRLTQALHFLEYTLWLLDLYSSYFKCFDDLIWGCQMLLSCKFTSHSVINEVRNILHSMKVSVLCGFEELMEPWRHYRKGGGVWRDTFTIFLWNCDDRCSPLTSFRLWNNSSAQVIDALFPFVQKGTGLGLVHLRIPIFAVQSLICPYLSLNASFCFSSISFSASVFVFVFSLKTEDLTSEFSFSLFFQFQVSAGSSNSCSSSITGTWIWNGMAAVFSGQFVSYSR